MLSLFRVTRTGTAKGLVRASAGLGYSRFAAEGGPHRPLKTSTAHIETVEGGSGFDGICAGDHLPHQKQSRAVLHANSRPALESEGDRKDDRARRYGVPWYFREVHVPFRVTPAIKSSLGLAIRDFDWIGDLLEARALNPVPGTPRGAYTWYRAGIETGLDSTCPCYKEPCVLTFVNSRIMFGTPHE